MKHRRELDAEPIHFIIITMADASFQLRGLGRRKKRVRPTMTLDNDNPPGGPICLASSNNNKSEPVRIAFPPINGRTDRRGTGEEQTFPSSSSIETSSKKQRSCQNCPSCRPAPANHLGPVDCYMSVRPSVREKKKTNENPPRPAADEIWPPLPPPCT